MPAGMPAALSSGLWLSLGAAGVLAAAGMVGQRTGGFGRVSVLDGASVLSRGRGSRTVIPSHAGRVGRAGRADPAKAKADRQALSASDFVFPEDRSYPISDRRHGQLALTYVAAPSNRMKRYRVMQAVFARYPDLRAWWNETPAGKHDPANVNSWRTTLYEYQALLPRLTVSSRVPAALRADNRAAYREQAEVEDEIEALRVLSRGSSR